MTTQITIADLDRAFGTHRTKCCGSHVYVEPGEPQSCMACLDDMPEVRTDNEVSFLVYVETVGNPDFGQYAPITSPTLLGGDTMDELKQAVRSHQNVFQIGGGNWTYPPVYSVTRAGERLGYMSYNGRIWKHLPNSANCANEVGICGHEVKVA